MKRCICIAVMLLLILAFATPSLAQLTMAAKVLANIGQRITIAGTLQRQSPGLVTVWQYGLADASVTVIPVVKKVTIKPKNVKMAVGTASQLNASVSPPLAADAGQ